MDTCLQRAVLVLLFVSLLAPPTLASDIDTLEMRLEEAYLEGSSWNADTYLGSQLADGSWDDIDYGDRSRTSWNPNDHLSRLERMAIAYASEGNTYFGDAAMLDAIERGLAYWYARKPESDNWRFNDIGQQLNLGPILIIMEDSLDDSLVDTGAGYLNDPEATGQNLVWYATQTVQRGCLRESLADVNTGLDAIKNEEVITTDEGASLTSVSTSMAPSCTTAGTGGGSSTTCPTGCTCRGGCPSVSALTRSTSSPALPSTGPNGWSDADTSISTARAARSAVSMVAAHRRSARP